MPEKRLTTRFTSQHGCIMIFKHILILFFVSLTLWRLLHNPYQASLKGPKGRASPERPSKLSKMSTSTSIQCCSEKKAAAAAAAAAAASLGMSDTVKKSVEGG
ncbi:MAG: hypothetical protein FRX49_09708 [Trebouxia sp. A1-2]|nr:MAG: hypothetical protein FRX49_09708 [Trebouxia sp. A1-2]